jgi:hypothetical protein
VSAGHGWYGFGLDVDATARALEGVRVAAGQVERPRELGTLEISVTPPRGQSGMDRETAARYAALGVDRLILLPRRDTDLAGLEAYVAASGELIGRV